jgi:5,10-methylene-tetrahydrofolate dehydrogenase/methenyl tetrahydrofolate cyclohydrolase
MRRYEPTPDQRRTVKTMAGFGVPHLDIATFLGIDAKTLRKHFREELDRGTTEANAKVAQSLFQMATQGKNVAAAIFWMKARAGWREKIEVKPVIDDPAQLTDAELEEIIRRGKHERRVIVEVVDEPDPPRGS